MSNELAQVIAAKSRLSRLEPDDIRIIEPLLDDRERVLSIGSVQFTHDGGGFLIDSIKFKSVLGLSYIHALLNRKHISIPCKKLDPIPGDVQRQELIDRDYLNDLVDEAKDLRRSIKNPGAYPEVRAYHEKKLADIRLVLEEVSHAGKPKNFTNELERCRQRVKHNIRRAIRMLWTHPDDWNLDIGPRREHPQTTYIAIHLNKTIETGNSCIYKGMWNWRTK